MLNWAFSFILLFLSLNALASEESFSVEINEEPRIIIVSIRGGFTNHDDAKKFDKLKFLDGSKNTIVRITSIGGLIHVGEHGINILRKISNRYKNGKHIVAFAENFCNSMCIPLFLSLEKRSVAPGTTFGFHGASKDGVYSPETTREYLDFIDKQMEKQDNPDARNWFRSHPHFFQSSDVHEMKIEDMEKRYSGFVYGRYIVSFEQTYRALGGDSF